MDWVEEVMGVSKIAGEDMCSGHHGEVIKGDDDCRCFCADGLDGGGGQRRGMFSTFLQHFKIGKLVALLLGETGRYYTVLVTSHSCNTTTQVRLWRRLTLYLVDQ